MKNKTNHSGRGQKVKPEQAKSKLLLWSTILVATLVGIATIFVVLSSPTKSMIPEDAFESAASQTKKAPKDGESSAPLKDIAARPVALDSKTEEETAKIIVPTDLAPSCVKDLVALEIISNDLSLITEYSSASENELDGIQSCLRDSGVPVACFKEEMQSSAAAKSCKSDLVKARSKLIASYHSSNPGLVKDPSLKANLVIAKITSDVNGSEMPGVFQLVDDVLLDSPHNADAHKLRGISGFVTMLTGKGDDNVKAKTLESVHLLKESSDPASIDIAQRLEYLTNLREFLSSQNPELLGSSEMIAQTLLSSHPDEPASYYRLMELAAIKNDSKAVFDWLDRGLALGSDKPHFETFQKLRQELKDGSRPLSSVPFAHVSFDGLSLGSFFE